MEELCSVCGDRSTGKYFGVMGCDGCKGFFRRSIRNNEAYICRFNQNCVIDKDNRNYCRCCRLTKCFRVGMKKQSVQNGRDPIKRKKVSIEENCVPIPVKERKISIETNYITLKPNLFVEPPITTEIRNRFMNTALSLETIIQSDQDVRQTSINNVQIIRDERGVAKVATSNDFYASTKEQVIILVTWAKSILAFSELPLVDKLALLRNHAGDNLVLGLVRRSLHLKDRLLLGNGLVINRDSEDVIGVNCRIMDEIVAPFKRIEVDETEFAILRTVIFFDPNANGLRDPEKIRTLRIQATRILEKYILGRLDMKCEGRFGEILLTLPAVRSIVGRVLDEVQVRKLLGMARGDKLLEDIMLGEGMISIRSDAEDYTASLVTYPGVEYNSPSITSVCSSEDSEESMPVAIPSNIPGIEGIQPQFEI